jgi:hypothetical protein
MDIKALLGDAYKEGMTLTEIETALAAVELPTDNTEIERLKAAVSKSNSEAAELKKQLRTKLTEDEAAKLKDAEDREKLQSDYNALLTKVTISENKAKLLAIGYDDKLADETAEAMANGELEKVFTNQKKHMENLEKKIRADVLKETPKPAPGGAGGKGITQEQFDAMGYTERLKVFNEQPELYNEFTGGLE